MPWTVPSDISAQRLTTLVFDGKATGELCGFADADWAANVNDSRQACSIDEFRRCKLNCDWDWLLLSPSGLLYLPLLSYILVLAPLDMFVCAYLASFYLTSLHTYHVLTFSLIFTWSTYFWPWFAYSPGHSYYKFTKSKISNLTNLVCLCTQ